MKRTDGGFRGGMRRLSEPRVKFSRSGWCFCRGPGFDEGGVLDRVLQQSFF